MEREGVMIISYKMVDGSRIDVPVTSAQKDAMIINLMRSNTANWFNVFEDERKQILLRASNIVSITINGEADDS